MSLKKNETKRKKLEEWEKQYRLDHPVYNLNHSYPSFAFGAVSAFLGAIMLVPFQMSQTTVTRYAFFCFAIGFAKESGRKQEINTKNFKIYDSFNFRIDSHICFVLVFSILHNKMDERIQRS